MAKSNESTNQTNYCENCTLKFENETFLFAHLLEASTCFWPLTKDLWFQPAGFKQSCTICKLTLDSAVALKRHCFEAAGCKLHYVKQYCSLRFVGSSTDDTVSSASISRTNSLSQQVPYDAPSTSSMLMEHDTGTSASSATDNDKGTSEQFKCEFCEKSFKEIRSLRVHITVKHEENGGQSNPQNSSKSPKRYTCKLCKKYVSTQDDLISHVLTRSACLKLYEHDKSPAIVSYCFKCKRKFKSKKEAEHHKCVGVVLQKYQCAVCPENRSTIKSLRTHENKAHKV